jgi:hypothetical protein
VPENKDPAAAAGSKAAPPKKEGRVKLRSRCRNCGYVILGSKAGKGCPACGFLGEADREAFAPYEEKPAEKRARLLRLRLHPMASHAPPAFAATLLAMAAALATVGEAPIRTALVDAARVLATLLPVSIAAAFLTGLVDGRARLKKGTTPLLVKKAAVSALFLALSFATAALALFTDLGAAVLVPFAALATLCVACALYLGRRGAGLRDAMVPD